MEVELGDGTTFRHPKKEGILPTDNHSGRKCVRVLKQGRDKNTGIKYQLTNRYFYYQNSAEYCKALEMAVKFRDGLWTEVAAGKKSVEELKKWAKDWKDEGRK